MFHSKGRINYRMLDDALIPAQSEIQLDAKKLLSREHWVMNSYHKAKPKPCVLKYSASDF